MTTSTLLEFTRNSIWQGFAALTDYEGGFYAPKSRLKVFAASIGTVLDSSGVENGLDDFRSSTSLNFAEFEFYLAHEVFSVVCDVHSRSDLAIMEKYIEEVCWTLTRSKLDWNRRNSALDKTSAFQLFRIFCLLADLIRDDDGNAQVVISPEEADLVFRTILDGVTKEMEAKDKFECLFSNAIFDFQTFLSVIEIKFLKEFPKNEVIAAIQDLYDEYVDDIIKKGSFLKRRGYLAKYVERLFTLRPTGLLYYKNPKKPKLIKFDAQTRVEDGKMPRKSKFFLFNLIAADRTYQFATLDKKNGLQWMTALKLAVSRLDSEESYGRHLSIRRRLEWHRNKIRLQKELDRTHELLLAEKMARHAAEKHAEELATQKASEEAQKLELEETRRTLESLLAEEIQAKQDEEMVRSLQARILSEEWGKRDELERLQEKQRKMLDLEQKKSRAFQKRQVELEKLLEEAERKLKALETSRLEMDSELKAARLKNKERNQEILTMRMNLFKAPIVVEDGNTLKTRRCVSLRENRAQHYSTRAGLNKNPTQVNF